MTNSLRRPRRRPRVVSVNFRSFFWVLLREAALELLCSHGEVKRPYSSLRSYVARCDSAAIRHAVARRAFPRGGRRSRA